MGKKNRQARDMESSAPVAADEAMDMDAVEEVAPPQEEPAVEEVPKLDFDGWHAMRKHKIPHIHKKEILKADFKANKVPALATIAEFDAALKKYGVSLA
jgi:hypothetical protein